MLVACFIAIFARERQHELSHGFSEQTCLAHGLMYCIANARQSCRASLGIFHSCYAMRELVNEHM